MPLPDYGNEMAGAWSTPAASAAHPAAAAPAAAEPSVESTLEKERTIKTIFELRDGLRGLLVRITEVEKETDKLRNDNEFLGTYIDNLTRNTVVAAGQKR
ncbi:Short coiled-coil [Vanrija pseudolonga]|uniref:Short coiled-coil n=1 Tax=Vanrija pseudolonga TaxID=143232 RepID=A0AAF1BKK1_9TREE|nr:Short coiled-coil [Vanrija pseudolonga]